MGELIAEEEDLDFDMLFAHQDTFELTLDKELIEKLDTLAGSSYISRNDLIRSSLEYFIKQLEANG